MFLCLKLDPLPPHVLFKAKQDKKLKAYFKLKPIFWCKTEGVLYFTLNIARHPRSLMMATECRWSGAWPQPILRCLDLGITWWILCSVSWSQLTVWVMALSEKSSLREKPVAFLPCRKIHWESTIQRVNFIGNTVLQHLFLLSSIFKDYNETLMYVRIFHIGNYTNIWYAKILLAGYFKEVKSSNLTGDIQIWSSAPLPFDGFYEWSKSTNLEGMCFVTPKRWNFCKFTSHLGWRFFAIGQFAFI